MVKKDKATNQVVRRDNCIQYSDHQFINGAWAMRWTPFKATYLVVSTGFAKMRGANMVAAIILSETRIRNPDVNGPPGYTAGNFNCPVMKLLYNMYTAEVDYANVKLVIFGNEFQYEAIVFSPFGQITMTVSLHF